MSTEINQAKKGYFCPGLVVTHRAGDIVLVPEVPALCSVRAVSSYCSTVSVVWKTWVKEGIKPRFQILNSGSVTIKPNVV